MLGIICHKTVNCGSNGIVLITTRNDHIKNIDFIKESDVISIDMLTEKEAMELFTRIYFHKVPKELLREQYEKTIQFLKYVPPFPLDISIAARYLANSKISYQEYIKQLYKANQDFCKMQSQLISETSDYTRTRYNIITLAMNQILKLNHDLAGLLLLVSLIDSQNINRDFIANYCGSHKADELLGYMHHYGVIHPKSRHTKVFLMHRSIQEIIRHYMFDFFSSSELNTNLEKISDVFYARANQAIDSDEYSKMQYFLSHFLAFIKCVPSNTRAYHKISTQIGKIYSNVYFFKRARPLVEANVRFFRKGDKNRYLLAKNLSTLGRIEFHSGNFKKSVEYLEESIDIYKKFYENNKVEFAESLMSLGWTHLTLGNYVQAKQFIIQGTNIFREYYGIKHARTARCFFRLAGVYLQLGEIKNAKKYAIQSLEIFQNIGQNVKQQIAWAHYRLGDAYRMEGHYLKALEHIEPAYVELIKIEKTPGEVGPVWTMSCLCDTYLCLGNIKKSEPVLKELVNNTAQYYGENNILSAWFSTFLGRYYLALENYTEAKKIFEKSLAIYKKELGENHIDSVFIKHCLAKTYLGLKLFDQTEQMYEKCIQIYRKHYGIIHVEYAKLLCDIAHLYILKKNFSKAESLLQEGSKTLEVKKHDEVYRCYEYWGDLYHAKGQEKQAQIYYVKSFNYLKQHFPKNSAHIARLKSKIPFIKRCAPFNLLHKLYNSL